MISSKATISLIVIAYNEEKNIENCLKSVSGLADEIFVVDSYSSDRTLEIVRKHTDKVYQYPFETQAKQFNWALKNLPISSEWIIRLDADERITPELKAEILSILPNIPSEITGFYIKRRLYFMGRWIKFGGYYPTWILRIWQKGKGYFEEQLLNEHLFLLEGKAMQLKHDIIDWNQKGLSFWIDKHNEFSNRYAQEIMAIQDGLIDETAAIIPSLFASQAQRKRWLKQNLYVHLPLFIRSFLYFFYRYFIRLGFLDGKEGLVFHFLQGFWYHFLADAKIYEYRKRTEI